MKRILIALPLLALAACVEPAAPLPEPDTDACKASSYQGLVGQPGAVLKSMMLPAGSRVIEPGQPVTMDYRVDRLNIEIGTDGRIAKVACY
ncbi:MAG TPA: I78 family peptidase inhibitor [Paracoccus sp. (in: a-proteobacteria)]|nr:I78 family peptidase inhibitor [Paracoccus sp. (in: a-proteobacteria)]